MAKFVFRLEAVLGQRKRVEQDRQRALAENSAVLVAAQSELKELDEKVQAATQDMRANRLTGLLDLNFLAAHRRFMGAMQRLAVNAAQRIAAAQKLVEEARAHLAEAAKQRKIIEKLREKQFNRWREEQARKEIADLDEVGGQIAYQNLSEAISIDDMDVEAAT